MHIQRTHTQAHMYNQHTKGMATTRHRSLVGRSGGKGFVRDRPSKKKIKNQRTDISNLKRFEQIELQAKLLNYFLESNKSNINQSLDTHTHRHTDTQTHRRTETHRHTDTQTHRHTDTLDT